MICKACPVCLLIVIYISSIVESDYVEVVRPRGVSLTRKVFYDPLKDFTCLDGSRTISFQFVNDDYCDCFDGSDEPGTSACPDGQYHCTNAGFRPLNIPSSRVNDGVCDCCDGSDEWKNQSLCPNTCKELWRIEKEEREKQTAEESQGYTIRQELAETGRAKKAEREAALKDYEEKLGLLKETEEKLKSHKDEIEAKETEAKDAARKLMEEELAQKTAEENHQRGEQAFAEMDTDKDGSLVIDEILQHKELDPNLEDGSFTEEEAKAILQNDAVDLSVFMESVWPSINGSFETTLSPPIEEQEQPSETSADVKESFFYDDATRELIEEAEEARKRYQANQDSKKNIEREIESLQKGLDMDFGPDEAFQALQFKCFDFETLEYRYKLCPYDKTSQTPNKGGSETNLGRWGSWSGPENFRYSKMKYENGLGCWNGPARSTEVRIRCGLEHKILSVDEPSRCAYVFEFATPCACTQPEPAGDSFPRDEL
ncbi:glucosidase 2 subunit beta-like isoform X2 [Clavelina lepadiformis]|uniref:glucosidase 2 subunit beta-like isoform X2 n=1 Tax=Clavelina lepadiformis TaxID=159417 RepID=UPI004042BF01